MKTILLCGGRGIYDFDSNVRIPKGMLMVGDRPLIWHIMKTFSSYGINEFILALGEGGQYIRNYFLGYVSQLQDIEVTIADGTIEKLNQLPEENWKIKLVDTGQQAQTGSRIARCRRYIDNEVFLLSYSDCLCNVNIEDLIAFHRNQGKIVTVTGVQPPSRFGTFSVSGDKVTGYSPITKLVSKSGYINGGYMVIDPSLFDYITPYNECTLEAEVFAQLANEGQVAVYQHDGYWQSIDTERDLIILNKIYYSNKRPWLPDAPAFQSGKSFT